MLFGVILEAVCSLSLEGQTLVLTIKAEDVTVKIGSKIIYQVALFSANKTNKVLPEFCRKFCFFFTSLFFQFLSEIESDFPKSRVSHFLVYMFELETESEFSELPELRICALKK